MPCRASSSMTGPTSTASSAGLPTRSSCRAPRSMASTRSAQSACTHSTRRAEPRGPALAQAGRATWAATCSARAEESTTIAFCPPVSAISATGWPLAPRRPASVLCRMRATSVEPVNMTPCTRASPTRRAPTVSPRPGSSCTAAGGTPAWCSRRTASWATSGVCSAGLASTTLPAASAAATWPRKMASGKFHGLMHATGPSGTWVALLQPPASTWAA